MTGTRRGWIAALSVLGMAATLFLAALARALTLQAGIPPAPAAVPSSENPAETSNAEPVVPSEAVLSVQDITLAVDNDPFLPDRARPEPYRLPGEDVLEAFEAPELPPAPEFRVTGTIVMGEQGVAVIQLEDSPPRVLSVGESLMGYRLDRVGATSATLVGEGRTLELALASGAPDASASAPGRGLQLSRDQLRALQQRFGDGINTLLERARRGGNDQSLAQSLLRQLLQQSDGRTSMIRLNDGRAVVIRRDTSDVPMRTPEQR